MFILIYNIRPDCVSFIFDFVVGNLSSLSLDNSFVLPLDSIHHQKTQTDLNVY